MSVEVRLNEAEVTESVHKSDHTVLCDSSSVSVEAVVIIKSQMSYWQVMNEDENGDIQEDCNKSRNLWIISQATVPEVGNADGWTDGYVLSATVYFFLYFSYKQLQVEHNLHVT
jgi:hypothetical protein